MKKATLTGGLLRFHKRVKCRFMFAEGTKTGSVSDLAFGHFERGLDAVAAGLFGEVEGGVGARDEVRAGFAGGEFGDADA